MKKCLDFLLTIILFKPTTTIHFYWPAMDERTTASELGSSPATEINPECCASNETENANLSRRSNVAYIYRNTTDSLVDGWTHSMPWKANDLIDLKDCPITGSPVGMVCDGLVANTSNNSQLEVVRFRFAKKTFQLSIEGNKIHPGSETTKKSNLNTGGWRSYLFGWLGVTHMMEDKDVQAKNLAQDRIVQALQLSSIKILHKGSLLYTATAGELNPSSSNMKKEHETMVSEALLKISEQDWKAGRGKSTLVVMGTHRENKLREFSVNDAVSGGDNILFQRMKRTIRIPMKIVWLSLKLSWYLVISLFEPFLPSRMLSGSSGNERNGERNNNTHRNERRTHQD